MSNKKDNEFKLEFKKYRHDGESYECPICKSKGPMCWGRCKKCGSSMTEEDK